MQTRFSSPRTDTSDALFAKLRTVLARYDVRDFAVYALEREEARLVFSSGVAAPLQAAEDGRIRVRDYPVLQTLTGAISGSEPADARAGLVRAFREARPEELSQLRDALLNGLNEGQPVPTGWASVLDPSGRSRPWLARS